MLRSIYSNLSSDSIIDGVIMYNILVLYTIWTIGV